VIATLSDKIGAMQERLANRAAAAKRTQYKASRTISEARRDERDGAVAASADESDGQRSTSTRRA
jgi:hypothetical protein